MSQVVFRALIACVAVGVFAPMIGTFLVQKRLSLMGDGVGHVAYAGVGAGLLFGVWPVWTALGFAVVGAAGVELLRMRRKASGDLALALFFYTGIALGAVFTSRIGNGHVDLESTRYLFGDPFLIAWGGVVVALVLGALISAAVLSLRRVLFAVVSDEDWARVSGLPVDVVNMSLAVVTAGVVIAGMRVVGILLIAPLMVLPVASAQLVARSFRSTLWIAVAIGATSSLLGLFLGRALNVSPGGTIVLTTTAVFTVVALAKRTVPRALTGTP
jgi:zinc transport system permease protein